MRASPCTCCGGGKEGGGRALCLLSVHTHGWHSRATLAGSCTWEIPCCKAINNLCCPPSPTLSTPFPLSPIHPCSFPPLLSHFSPLPPNPVTPLFPSTCPLHFPSCPPFLSPYPFSHPPRCCPCPSLSSRTLLHRPAFPSLFPRRLPPPSFSLLPLFFLPHSVHPFSCFRQESRGGGRAGGSQRGEYNTFWTDDGGRILLGEINKMCCLKMLLRTVIRR